MLRRLLSLAVLAALLAPAAAAEEAAAPGPRNVVRLRTGESIKGRPLRERSDDKTVWIEDLLAGTVRALAWEALEPADRDSIQEQWEWKRKVSTTVKGHRIVLKVGGDEDELYGLIEKEEGGTVYLRRGGELIPVPKDRIAETTEETMDPREIWNAQQLMDRFAQSLREKEPPEELTSPDAHTAMNVGEYAEWAGDLKTALEAYRRAAADPDFLNRATAEQRALRVEALLKDQAALATIRDLKTRLSGNLFRSVRKGLDEFDGKHPGASEAVQKSLASFKDSVAKRRDKYFRGMARWDFQRICVRLIEAKVREKDLKLNDAKSWAKKDLAKEAFAALQAKMAARDDVTEDEVRAWWDTRWDGVPKGSWNRAPYGSGTFIAYPPKILPPKPKPAGGGNNRGGNNQGPAPAVTLPKPPTPDQWWNTHGPERVGWVMAHFVVTSGLFEVADDVDRKPCPLCQGVGIRTSTTQTGDIVAWICERCGGARDDIAVKFR